MECIGLVHVYLYNSIYLLWEKTILVSTLSTKPHCEHNIYHVFLATYNIFYSKIIQIILFVSAIRIE